MHAEAPAVRRALGEPLERLAAGEAWTGPSARQWQADLSHHEHATRVRLARLIDRIEAEIRSEPPEIPALG